MRPTARAISIIDRALGVVAWTSQIGAAALYLSVTAQPAVWRPIFTKDPVSVVCCWALIVSMTLLWMTGLRQEQLRFYNRRARRFQRKVWGLGHASVLFFAAVSASAHEERIGMWGTLAMGTMASLLTWTSWMRTKQLPAEDQAVIDAIHDREAQQAAAVFDASEKERRRERLSAIVAGLGYQLADAPTAATARAEEPPVRWPIPSGKHAPVVYFIRNGNRIKIGTTTELKRRIRTLALRAENVALLVDGGQQLERAFHRQFADLRVGSTEWFAHEGLLAEFITQQSRTRKDKGQ
jgi:hypothetical protein